jgi:hypothetical protein
MYLLQVFAEEVEEEEEEEEEAPAPKRASPFPSFFSAVNNQPALVNWLSPVLLQMYNV